MIVTIDSAGRLVVPKAIRDRANLRPEIPLEITFRDGRIEISPCPRRVSIQRKGRLHVAVPLEGNERLTDEVVRSTRRDLRDREE